MERQEMLDYLVSTGLYEVPKVELYNVKHMIDDGKTIPIGELVERFIKIDKSFGGHQWNILQILANIDMIIPLEDRKKNANER